MGHTTIDDVVPHSPLENGTRDGVRLPRIVGTYLHGAFENREVLEEVLQRRLDNDVPASREIQLRAACGLVRGACESELFAAEYLNR
jgi:cobyric acid synthase